MSGRLRSGSRAFAHRNYRLFFGGQGVSLVGTWMQSVAQAWLVLKLSGDPFVLGLLSAVQFLPVLAFGLFGGIIADALPKRQTLIVTQTVQMLLAFALFVLSYTNTVQVWHILVLAGLLGLSNAVDMPTRQAFAVEMVGRDDIQNAVALNSALFNGARIVGPAVAGIAIGVFGIALAFLINAISFLAVIVAYAVMRDEDLRSPARYHRPTTVRDVARTLADGLRYVSRSPMLLMPIVMIGVVSTFGMNFGVVIPALADEVLKTDATGFGFLMACTGLGSMAAALLIAFTGRTRPVVIGLGAIALGVGLFAAGLITSFTLALPAMALIGFGAIGMAATANTTIQLNVEDEYRGRVMSVYTTVFAGSTPIGGLFVGWLASASSVPMTMLVSGVLCVLTGSVGLVWYRQIRARGIAPVLVRERVGASASTAGARPR
ncbi:MAG TPA: MFS transporter [Candidatus Limnocylindrales bacterium]